MKRNCSMSPRQVAIAYGTLCLFTFTIASAFAARGMWMVLAYAVLESGGLAVALLYYARHALDHEHIALSDGCLLVERVQAGACEQVRLDPYFTRISLPSRQQRLIRIESRGVSLEVGCYVSDDMRRKVAGELRAQLRASSYGSQWR
ncbi:DUF2244 domain-containing protein [Massilia soli]|uniref:DUF2244 domain-containing protein n=1 Tax=Massilia soli TaxID=2792854 RepID=A0ABS7SVK0_9BURK|nr:DUF2244 domain-containing protein [Massilia soli]MBZ2209940.1 DUF2244 domain-containing protein [Massilia soli]